MGTRADFYVKGPTELEWLGSIAWDGYPDGIEENVLAAENTADFREAVNSFLTTDRDDATLPERGWPWPWKDSGTTDYAYVFVEGVGVVHKEGRRIVRSIKILNPDPAWVWDDDIGHAKNAEVAGVSYRYPDMSDRKNTRWDKGSGLIIIGGPA